MYENYFNLDAKPFHMTPDLDLLFLSAKHKEAISCMEFGVKEDIGIILLTGEIGTGKTTLIRHIIEGIKDDIDVAAIYNTNVTTEQLIASVMEQFGLDPDFDNKSRAVKALQTHFKSLRALKRKPLLIIDDAQNLSLKTLEEIRLIAQLQNSIRMLVQIILVGQPKLEAKLGDPNASSLAQRVSISYHLLPFSRKEAEEYIIYRLNKVGGRSSLFNQAAIDLVYNTTGGIPRTINLLCDNAMTYAHTNRIKCVDAPCITAVLKENRNRSIRPEKRNLKKTSRAMHGVPAHSRLSSQNQPCSRSDGSNWQIEISHRMDALERFVTASTKELKALLRKERQRNDKLILAYTHLKNKFDALHKVKFEREPARADMTTRKTLARSSTSGRRFAQLVSQKK